MTAKRKKERTSNAHGRAQLLPDPKRLPKRQRASARCSIRTASRSTALHVLRWKAPPVPLPKPKKKEEEEKPKCKLVGRAVPRGNDPLSELFCIVVMPGAPSYDIYSPVGVAEIDALAGRTWYECKCGYGGLVRGAERGDWLSRVRLDEMDEQIRRHMRIAAACGLIYRFVVSREDVAALVRSRHWDVDAITFGWEPCE